MNELSEQQLADFRSILTARGRELHLEVQGVENDRNEALTASRAEVEDAGDEAEVRREDEVRSAEEDRDEGELREIEAALARLDAGQYGICVDCDEPIPLPRLQARPSATRCIACQEVDEKRAQQAGA